MSITIYDLPKDILILICKYLSSTDNFAFILSSYFFYEKLWDPIIFDFFNKCCSELEDNWNYYLVSDIFSQPCKNYHKLCDGCYRSSNKTITCSIFPWKKHNLKVEYCHNPRDIDILSWFDNGNLIGYTIL
jgi:hypothetical protein